MREDIKGTLPMRREGGLADYRVFAVKERERGTRLTSSAAAAGTWGPIQLKKKIILKILPKILSKSYNKKFNKSVVCIVFKLEFHHDFR